MSATNIFVLGQNPALSMSDPLKAFVGTKSGNKLMCWLEEAGVKRFILGNVFQEKTENNKPLKRSTMVKIARSQEFLDRIKAYEKVVAVGRQAEFTVEMAKIHHKLPNLKVLFVPHPSGLNRTLNVPGKEQEVIEMIRVFINGGLSI